MYTYSVKRAGQGKKTRVESMSVVRNLGEREYQYLPRENNHRSRRQEDRRVSGFDDNYVGGKRLRKDWRLDG